MKNNATYIILILILLGCKTSSDKSFIDSSAETKIDSTVSVETEKYETNYQNEVSNPLGWTNTFGKNSLGLLKTGDSLSTALSLLNEIFIVKFDSIEACEGCFDEFEYYYSVYEDYNLLFTLTPGYEDFDKDLIFRFEIYDSRFKSENGIGIGNKVSELKEKYKLTEAYFAYDLGLFLFVENFDGSFGLSYDSYSDIESFNFEKATPETVPEKSVIDKIIIL